MSTIAIIMAIAVAFTALGILCAVRIGRSRPPPADPFSHPFGELALLPSGALIELHSHRDPARRAIRADQGSGGNGKSSQGAAAARFRYSKSFRLIHSSSERPPVSGRRALRDSGSERRAR